MKYFTLLYFTLLFNVFSYAQSNHRPKIVNIEFGEWRYPNFGVTNSVKFRAQYHTGDKEIETWDAKKGQIEEVVTPIYEIKFHFTPDFHHIKYHIVANIKHKLGFDMWANMSYTRWDNTRFRGVKTISLGREH